MILSLLLLLLGQWGMGPGPGLGSGIPLVVDGWLMNEGGCTTFATSSGTGNNLTATSLTCGSVAGFPGTVPAFSGSGYAVATNQTATNFTGATPFSVCAWIKPTASVAPAVVSTLNPSSSFIGWELSIDSSLKQSVFLVNAYSGNAIEVHGTTAMSTGSIYHSCFTYDGSKTAAGVTFYLNGVAVGKTTSLDSLTGSMSNTIPVQIGRRADGSAKFQGNIADVRIWNKQLGSNQISAIYAAGVQ